MNTRYFWIYHLLGWFCAYLGIVLSLYLAPVFVEIQLFFAAVLVLSTCIYSYTTRCLYKRYFSHFSLAKQAIYFTLQALIGASFATFVLIGSVFLASWLHWTPPISAGQYGFVIETIFWGNVTNMFIASIVWGALYMSIIRARQLKETEQELATSQLHSLIQQLNPHFLFNMLNNIRALILEEPERARNALAQLSDMLRYSLNQLQMNKVSFAEELNIVEEYLELCKIQFEHRLSYCLDVAPNAEQALIPRMLLQLCAENAVKHGISKLTQGGEINVKAVLEKDSLLIEVTNPIPLASQTTQPRKDGDGGVGLSNIKQRFTLLYPEQQYAQAPKINLVINNDSNLATVTIVLPLEYAQE